MQQESQSASRHDTGFFFPAVKCTVSAVRKAEADERSVRCVTEYSRYRWAVCRATLSFCVLWWYVRRFDFQDSSACMRFA